MDWKNRVVFLTGASSGIGEGLAIALAARGAIVGLLARRAEFLSEIASKCENAGGKARIFPCDVTDTISVQAAADDLRREFGRIDVMIANAGVGGSDSAVREFQPDPVKRLIEINLFGAINAVYAVLPQMLEQGSGQIVGVSSLAGFRGLPKSAAYSASKAGMTNYFESLRLDVEDRGIDVTIIHPGFIKTPLTAGREKQMPWIMELDDAIPHFIGAIEKKKKFAAFPWQLAILVRLGRFFPAFIYDRIAKQMVSRS